MGRRRRELIIVGLGAASAVNAFGGSIYGLKGAPNVPLEWLEGSPFRDYRVPSLVLGVAVGGTSAAAALTAWRGSDRAGRAGIVAGIVMLGWIGTQVAIIGPLSVLQPVMAGVGAVLIGAGASLR